MLLIGGGKVAFRKACVLIDNQIEFKIVAQDYLEEFDTLDVEKNCKCFDAGDLNGYGIIVDATGDPSVAQVILNEKQQRYLLVNFATSPERSDFFFSSLINYGELKVAVSTEGASPTIGRFVRDRIKEYLPRGINTLLKKLAVERKSGVITPESSLKQIEEAFTCESDSRH
jgi:uroporphyrin-III C-methyltransferase/precorrin-2 dehydrogenase/sirohydrochlorin ferrochelatase